MLQKQSTSVSYRITSRIQLFYCDKSGRVDIRSVVSGQESWMSESRSREMLVPESWNLESVMVRVSDDGVTPSNTRHRHWLYPGDKSGISDLWQTLLVLLLPWYLQNLLGLVLSTKFCNIYHFNEVEWEWGICIFTSNFLSPGLRVLDQQCPLWGSGMDGA